MVTLQVSPENLVPVAYFTIDFAWVNGALMRSSGANLNLGVLSHILHPHPKIPPLSLSTPLKGVILLSPWASFRTDWPSTEANGQKDIVTPYCGDLWSANFLGTSIKDNYNEPIQTDVKWWSGLQEIVGEIFVVGGRDEVLLDSILEMGKTLEVSTTTSSSVIPRSTILAILSHPAIFLVTSYAFYPFRADRGLASSSIS